MKSVVIALGLMVCSCTSVGDPADQPDSPVTPGAPGLPGDDGVGGSSPSGPCGYYQPALIDGIIQVPVACDPYWKDKGDPPPDAVRSKTQEGRPLPDLLVVKSQTQT